MIRKCQEGISLLELMLTVAFGAVISLILYRSFTALVKGSATARSTTALSSSIMLARYHMQADINSCLLISNMEPIVQMRELMVKQSSQKSTQPQEDARHDDKMHSAPPESADSKKISEKIGKDFEKIISFLPSCMHQEDEIRSTFPTARSLSNSVESLGGARVSYYLTQSKAGQGYWQLMRSESSLHSDCKEEVKKETPRYVLLSRLKDMKMTWYIPSIGLDEIRANGKEAAQKAWVAWLQAPTYKEVEEWPFYSAEQIESRFFMPVAFCICGLAYAEDYKRHEEFRHLQLFHGWESLFERWLYLISALPKDKIHAQNASLAQSTVGAEKVSAVEII